LLPIPILDGGQLVFLIAEAVRRRPLPLELRLRLTQIGFVVLLGIMILATSNDILRWLGHVFRRSRNARRVHRGAHLGRARGRRGHDGVLWRGGKEAKGEAQAAHRCHRARLAGGGRARADAGPPWLRRASRGATVSPAVRSRAARSGGGVPGSGNGRGKGKEG